MNQRERGQIIPRGESRWLVRVYVGRTANNKRKYSSKTVEGTYRQADQERTKLLRELDTGTFVEPSKQSLTDFIKAWLAGKVDISERTRRDYRTLLENYVEPALGHMKLHKLSGLHIQQLYATLSVARPKVGDVPARKALAPRTIQYVHVVLNQALEAACAWNMLAKNPCKYVNLPRLVKSKQEVLTPEQTHLFLERVHDDPLIALWALLLTAGLRPGEALALKWEDLTGNTLHIHRTLVEGEKGSWSIKEEQTKTNRGRSVALPASTLAMMQAHRIRQLSYLMTKGNAYIRQNFIFANSVGGFLDLSQVRRLWKRLLRTCGMPPVKLYGARHTHLTHLMAAGVNAKMVAERAGHSTTRLTLDTYSHVSPEMQQETAGIVEGLIFNRKAL